MDDVPEFRRVFRAPAFSDGWALYAASSRSDQALASVRLVVDTGIHALGWPRERAIEYFSTHASGEAAAEVDRIIAWPGLALAAKVGELKIRELRRRAQQDLGARFDPGEFHDAVLGGGALPLDLVEQQVGVFIARARRN